MIEKGGSGWERKREVGRRNLRGRKRIRPDERERTIMIKKEREIDRKREEFPLAPIGVLAPVSAQPPSALAEFFWRTFLQNNLQTSPPATAISLN